MLSDNRPHVVHVSEVLATGILEFIYSLSTSIEDYNHTIIFRIRELGHDDESIRKLFPANIKLHKWENVDRPISLTKDTLAAKELYHLLKSHNPDLIHLHSSKAGFLGRLVGPLVVDRSAIIYTPNGAPFARTDLSSKKKSIYKYCEKFANFFSGKVVCVSQSETDTYKSIGIPSSFINNGVTLQNENLVFNKKHNGRKLRIVSAGRVTFQKDPISFNRIAQYYLDDDRVEFIWIGDGKKKKFLSSPNIKLTGWISKSEVYDYLSNASIYLSTALWEGLPFSVLEAMSIGLPVVISNCIGNIDLIEHGKSGFLYKNEEESIQFINRFLEQPELINEIGKESWNRCSSLFSKNQMALKYKSLYDNTLK